MNKALPLPIKISNNRSVFLSKYKKPLSLLVIAYFLHIVAFGANKSVSNSGNWSGANVWGGNGSAPAAGDNVTIGAGKTITVDITNAQCAKITLDGGTLIISTGKAITLTGDLAIANNSSGTLTV